LKKSQTTKIPPGRSGGGPRGSSERIHEPPHKKGPTRMFKRPKTAEPGKTKVVGEQVGRKQKEKPNKKKKKKKKEKKSPGQSIYKKRVPRIK